VAKIATRKSLINIRGLTLIKNWRFSVVKTVLALISRSISSSPQLQRIFLRWKVNIIVPIEVG